MCGCLIPSPPSGCGRPGFCAGRCCCSRAAATELSPWRVFPAQPAGFSRKKYRKGRSATSPTIGSRQASRRRADLRHVDHDGRRGLLGERDAQRASPGYAELGGRNARGFRALEHAGELVGAHGHEDARRRLAEEDRHLLERRSGPRARSIARADDPAPSSIAVAQHSASAMASPPSATSCALCEERARARARARAAAGALELARSIARRIAVTSPALHEVLAPAEPRGRPALRRRRAARRRPPRA